MRPVGDIVSSSFEDQQEYPPSSLRGSHHVLAPLAPIYRVLSTGIFGDQGKGLVSALGLERHPALLASMHSFGKALGAHGAVVVGSSTLKAFLINYARPLIYSTSLPLHR